MEYPHPRRNVSAHEARGTAGRCAAGLVALILGTPIVALAQEDAQPASHISGDAVFRTYCGSCHGQTAKGDGPLADSLRLRPADLTMIAKHNGGKFDGEKVHRIIDGRSSVRGHGGTDMPVWGDAFKHSGEGYSEEAVKNRIQAIVDYLASIQVK